MRPIRLIMWTASQSFILRHNNNNNNNNNDKNKSVFKDMGFYSSSYPQWKAVVHLKCDPSKSENDGDLAFISFKDNEWVRGTANCDLMLYM